MPRISVVLPTYNRATYLRKSIESVLCQSEPDFELIVVDDASTDDTPGLVKEYTQDQRLSYIRLRRNRGPQYARNCGIDVADSDWIAFLDSDDTWARDRIEKAFEVIANTCNEVVCSNGMACFQDGSRENMEIPKLNGNVLNQLLRGPGPFLQGLTVKKELIVAMGRLDTSLKAFQEWDTHIRLSMIVPFTFLDEPLFFWNRHDGDSITNNYRQNATGYAQTVDKHARLIREVCGTTVLSAHYVKCASLFHKIGNSMHGCPYLRKAISFEQRPNVRATLFECLANNTFPECKSDIRVYGEARHVEAINA